MSLLTVYNIFRLIGRHFCKSTYHSWRGSILSVVCWCHLCCMSQEKGDLFPYNEGYRSHKRNIRGYCTQKDSHRL